MLQGAFGLLFLVGMGLWMLILPRMRRTTIILAGLGCLLACIAILCLMNGLGENWGSVSDTEQVLLLSLLPVEGLS